MTAQEIANEINGMLDCRRGYLRACYQMFQRKIADLTDVDVKVNQSNQVELRIWGGGITLCENGHWYFNDTSGG